MQIYRIVIAELQGTKQMKQSRKYFATIVYC